jgi:hypothetical protein
VRDGLWGAEVYVWWLKEIIYGEENYDKRVNFLSRWCTWLKFFEEI